MVFGSLMTMEMPTALIFFPLDFHMGEMKPLSC